MPRQARIDAPGALHHIIIRGIERRAIFRDDKDREDFLERLSGLLEETTTPCYAWALMTNHVHLLLRTGKVPIASVMRRLLTGYAVKFNRKHNRHGHLFQNRYKSILCEEDAYLIQLVAYIHLNPLRVGMVKDIASLRVFPYAGQSALMGKMSFLWQDTEYVLRFFGKTLKEARRNLESHVMQWASKGRCPELTGGGLIRSSGGWRVVKEAARNGIQLKGDERMLGSSEFVQKTLEEAEETYTRKMRLQFAGVDLSRVIVAVCSHFGINDQELITTSKRQKIAQARAVISHIATQELLVTGSDVARRLNVDRSAVSRAIRRVEGNPNLIKEAGSILRKLSPDDPKESQQ